MEKKQSNLILFLNCSFYPSVFSKENIYYQNWGHDIKMTLKFKKSWKYVWTLWIFKVLESVYKFTLINDLC